jgi:hypothetical protein
MQNKKIYLKCFVCENVLVFKYKLTLFLSNNRDGNSIKLFSEAINSLFKFFPNICLLIQKRTFFAIQFKTWSI